MQRRNARNKFLPSLDITSANGINTSNPSQAPTDPWASTTTLALTETVFDGAQSWLSYDLASQQKEIQVLTTLRTRDQTLLSVAAAFYQYSLQTQLVDVRRGQWEVLEKRLKSVTAQYNQGLTPSRDYLRFRNQAMRAEIDAKNAITQQQTAAWTLRQAMGLTGSEGMAIEFDPVPYLPSTPTLPAEPPPVANHYDYRLAKMKRELNPIQIRLAQFRYYPMLTLALGVSNQYANYLGAYNADLWNNAAYSYSLWNAYATATVAFNLIDFGTRGNDIAIERANLQKADFDIRKADADLNAQFRNRMLSIAQGERNLKMNRELLRSEENAYEAVRRAYEEGKAPFLDLVTSLGSLLDARVGVFTAYFNLLDALIRYRYDEGTLYATLFP